MDLKVWQSVTRQRVLENRGVVDSALGLYTMWGFALAALGRRKRAVDALSQVHRTTRTPLLTTVIEPYIMKNFRVNYRDPQLMSTPDLKSFFGNRLMVLKPPAPGGEKGVLFAMVSVMFPLLHSNMDLRKLLADYTLVFEPSWSGYCHSEMLEYTRWTDDVFVLAAEKNDYAFLKRLGSNLIPVELGPCDWVDPTVAEPYLSNPKEFDIVMNSNWGAWKRHHVLFRMLRNAKRRYKVLLIGVKWSGKFKADIVRLADFYGVTDQLTIIEDIPYQKVMDLTCRSKVSILLSLKEGSNRAIAESIFCNLPVIVLSNHVGGIRKTIAAETGLLSDEKDLESSIEQLMNAHLNPREWGLKNNSCIKSTERLNEVLRDKALRRGRPWTQDIAVRSNSPESKYLSSDDAKRLAPWNERLKDYLR
jgi:glycosyltransferase involved in cell wall biosynthesis